VEGHYKLFFSGASHRTCARPTFKFVPADRCYKNIEKASLRSRSADRSQSTRQIRRKLGTSWERGDSVHFQPRCKLQDVSYWIKFWVLGNFTQYLQDRKRNFKLKHARPALWANEPCIWLPSFTLAKNYQLVLSE